MTEKKLIKALEYCKNKDNDCKGCPTYEYCENDTCGMVGSVLDIIKRIKAENKELWEERNRIYESLKETKTELERYRKGYVDAQSEIERLQSTNNRLKEDIEHTLDNQVKLIKISKSEGRKELAERLKTKAFRFTGNDYHTVLADDIDNLVKEMENE